MAAGDGLISMTPSSIAYSGTSATINADGGVDFSAVTSLSLNGVFTGDYDNYLIVIACTASADWNNIQLRLRAAGSDASGTNYVWQYLSADSTTAGGGRLTSANAAHIASADDALYNGTNIHLYGPYLAQPTAMRGVNVVSYGNAAMQDVAATHSLSTSYDGVTLFPQSGNITGNIHVFGYEE